MKHTYQPMACYCCCFPRCQNCFSSALCHVDQSRVRLVSFHQSWVLGSSVTSEWIIDKRVVFVVAHVWANEIGIVRSGTKVAFIWIIRSEFKIVLIWIIGSLAKAVIIHSIGAWATERCGTSKV